MADQKEPKKETVRITLPPPPAGPATAGRETARINLPARPPANGMAPRPPISAGAPAARPPQAQTPLPPPPARAVAPPPVFRKAPVPPPSASSAAPAGVAPLMPRPAPVAPVGSGTASSAGPRKETARISLLPEPPTRPAPVVEMKKTQPLITMPERAKQTASIAVNLAPTAVETFIDEIPMPLCWALLAASIATLTIQIWNYLS